MKGSGMIMRSTELDVLKHQQRLLALAIPTGIVINLSSSPILKLLILLHTAQYSKSAFSKYTGEFFDGKPRGFGQYRYAGLELSCEGNWDSAGSGWACIHYDSGLVYEGDCRDSSKHGYVSDRMCRYGE
jgi:hypothetical protein